MLMRAWVFGNTSPSGKSSLTYVLVVSSQKVSDGLGGSFCSFWVKIPSDAVIRGRERLSWGCSGRWQRGFNESVTCTVLYHPVWKVILSLLVQML